MEQETIRIDVTYYRGTKEVDIFINAVKMEAHKETDAIRLAHSFKVKFIHTIKVNKEGKIIKDLLYIE